MKVAIVYDRVNKWGGAEKVLLSLNKIFPKAPLYCAVYNSQKAPWSSVFPKIFPSLLNKIPFAKNNHELLGFLTPIAFELFNFDEYDLVITVTSEAAKGIITKPGTTHICYCLTPTRYLWSGHDEYLSNPPKKLSWIPFYQMVSRPFISYLKKWDLVASGRPDKFIAISTEVKSRIKKYYKRESEIVFPPVETKRFNTPHFARATRGKQCSISKLGSMGEYYLIVSRLVPYKKVDQAIRAFNRIGKKLVIIGKGSEEKYLKSIARDNIIFKGFISDEKLVDYFQKAKAFIYPQEEDFGITAVEAQAAGLPVIAYKKGGAVDTVIDGETGVFFEKQTESSLIKAVRKFEKMNFSKKKIVENAEKYSEKRFSKEILGIVKSLM